MKTVPNLRCSSQFYPENNWNLTRTRRDLVQNPVTTPSTYTLILFYILMYDFKKPERSEVNGIMFELINNLNITNTAGNMPSSSGL